MKVINIFIKPERRSKDNHMLIAEVEIEGLGTIDVRDTISDDIVIKICNQVIEKTNKIIEKKYENLNKEKKNNNDIHSE